MTPREEVAMLDGRIDVLEAELASVTARLELRRRQRADAVKRAVHAELDASRPEVQSAGWAPSGMKAGDLVRVNDRLHRLEDARITYSPKAIAEQGEWTGTIMEMTGWESYVQTREGLVRMDPPRAPLKVETRVPGLTGWTDVSHWTVERLERVNEVWEFRGRVNRNVEMRFSHDEDA